MQIRAIIISLFIFTQSFAHCEYKTNIPLITDALEQLMASDFPIVYDHYKAHLIAFKFFESKKDFFKTGYEITHIFKKGNQRLLYFYINPKIFDCAPSPKVLAYILSDHLNDLKDYITLSPKELILLRL